MSMQANYLVLKNSFQPRLYNIDLQVSEEKSNFSGNLTIDLERDTKSAPNNNDDFQLTLNSSELVIIASTVTTKSGDCHKADITYDKSKDRVNFTVLGAKSLYNEQTLALTVKYIGRINTIKTFRDFTKGLFKTNYLDDRTNTATSYVFATHCQASFARTIFPSVDEPVSKANFKLTIQTDSKFKVLSNTLPESVLLSEMGATQTVVFNKTPLMNTSVFGFVIGDLDFVESKVTLKNKTIPVRLFTTVGEISGAAYALDIVQKTLPFIETQFGVDYPLEKLDFVALPFLSDGAMENFGLVTIQSKHLLIDSLGNHELNQSIRQLVVHEIIHHWIGNLVSFDEWEHLWLNESFATWFAFYILFKLELDPLDTYIWEIQVDREFGTVVNGNSLAESKPVLGAKKSTNIRSTQDAFEVHAYQKGIQFLRMFSNVFESNNFNDDLLQFTQTLARFTHEFQYKSIKPTNFWKFFSDNSKIDLLTFAQSWLRVPGMPILSVCINAEGKIEIVQHRYLQESNVEQAQLEDIPYHVPLAIKLTDGSVINQILTDRRLVLTDIKLQEFVKLNTNRTGLFITEYNDVKFLNNMVENISRLSTTDLIGLVSDLSEVIGHETHHKDIAVMSVFKLTQALISESDLNFVVLNHLLNELQVINDAFKLFVDSSQYEQFQKWLIELNLKLFKRLEWIPAQYYRLSSAEIGLRKSVLTIGIKSKEVSPVSATLFKHLLHGPANSVPVEWLEPVIASTAMTASPNNWKKILELAKQPGNTEKHVIDGGSADIQHAALGAIGYTRDPALVKRVLNFVRDNVDSNLIELGLVGLQFDHEENSHVLWNWFKLNYDLWVGKTLRPGSQLADSMKKTLKGLSMVVFSWMNSASEQKLVNQFVKEKLKSLPKHDLEETLEQVRSSHSEKKKIAESFETILQHI